jgi:hypothetical protein
MAEKRLKADVLGCLNRTFVMPSQMCLNQQHNDKGLLHKSGKFEEYDLPFSIKNGKIEPYKQI